MRALRISLPEDFFDKNIVRYAVYSGLFKFQQLHTCETHVSVKKLVSMAVCCGVAIHTSWLSRLTPSGMFEYLRH